MYSNTDSPLQSSQNSLELLTNQFLYSPEDLDLEILNSLARDSYFIQQAHSAIPENKPVNNASALFNKQVILDDETILDIETLNVPGFIGITDELEIKDSESNCTPGYQDISQLLEKYGILICVYQWNRELYGIPIDIRSSHPTDVVSNFLVEQTIIKNDGNHSFGIVPAQELSAHGDLIKTFATIDQPGGICYRSTFFEEENNGRIAVAQHLVFPDYITNKQARGYADTIVSWMELLNCCVESSPVFDGTDPTRVIDRKTLKEFLKNAALASLGESDAIAFFKQPENLTYCSEFTYICLNTPLYPFNRQGLTLLLDGDEAKANQLLELRNKHNNKQATHLSIWSRSPKFQSFEILMPLVPEDLPPLDVLVAHKEHPVDGNSLPFPPFKVSHILHSAFSTLLPRHKIGVKQVPKVLQKLLKFIEPILIKQLQLDNLPDNAKVLILGKYIDLARQQLDQKFASYEEVQQVVDTLIQQIDSFFLDKADRQYLVPPRIFVDLGQNCANNHLPQGWGFKLKTIGALVYHWTLDKKRKVCVIFTQTF
ncbi:MAG: hypothetical protein F6K14_34635 [Symploca sp. SIO2C1]|nr:hypothetical protein [Symploca sp. SIO2C1]